MRSSPRLCWLYFWACFLAWSTCADAIRRDYSLARRRPGLTSTVYNGVQARDDTTSAFWLETIHQSDSTRNSTFKAFRNVKDFGAVGTGLQDDTAAISRAISDGITCKDPCIDAGARHTVIYFPSGNYSVSSTINIGSYTQIIGNPNEKPVLSASPSFAGTSVFSTLETTPNATATFVQIRNLVIDISAAADDTHLSAIHYQAGQGSSLQNIDFFASVRENTTQTGILTETINGGILRDLTFTGGQYGIYGGSQQFTPLGLKFMQCKSAAIRFTQNWGWSWQGIEISDSPVGFSLVSDDKTHHLGSILIQDSAFTNVGTAILTASSGVTPATGSTGVTLDNLALNNIQNAVADTTGKVLLPGSQPLIDTWQIGAIYLTPPTRDVSLGMHFPSIRNPSLTTSRSNYSKSLYLQRSRNQYEHVASNEFIHLKATAKGDGLSDDTGAVQRAINESVKSNAIVFVDSGTYLIHDTIEIPPGAKIVGEAWPQFVATGANFKDALSPRPLIRVGQAGSVGSVELQGLMFTAQEFLPGLVVMEWNVNAESPGSAALWDCHAILDSIIAAAEQNESAAALMVHVTQNASAYFEDMFVYGAAASRGILVESTGPTWLYGTTSEQAYQYQYQFLNASDIFADMLQVLSPNMFPISTNRSQDASLAFPGDDYCNSRSGCSTASEIRIVGSSDIIITGAAVYGDSSFLPEAEVDSGHSSPAPILLAKNRGSIRIHNLITYGYATMLNSDGNLILAADNLILQSRPRWSQIPVFDPLYAEAQNNVTQFNAVERLTNDISDEVAVESAASGGYVTLVNASPHDWIVTGISSYQMTTWNWPTIPAGSATRVSVGYLTGKIGKSSDDDGGDVSYSIDGTSQTFQIQARAGSKANPGPGATSSTTTFINFNGLTTKDVSQGSTVDIGFRSGRSVNWVLAGEDTRGYYTSKSPPVAWMSSMLDVIGNKKLKQICMPGSHDAGMDRINGATAGVSSQNTQTQRLDIYDQLIMGSRYFDIRPVLGNGGQFLTGHYSSIGGGINLGGNGISIDDLISQVNSFTSQNPELVILYLSHSFDTDNGYVELSSSQWDSLFSKLEGLNYRYTNKLSSSNTQLTDIIINDFIGNGQACVLVVVEHSQANPSPDRGFFGDDYFPHFDSYSDTEDPTAMSNDQIAKLKANKRTQDDNFHLLSWTLTLNAADSIFATDLNSIQSFAVGKAYDPLFYQAFPAFTRDSFPQVLYMDYLAIGGMVETGADQPSYEVLALAIAVNLRLANQS